MFSSRPIWIIYKTLKFKHYIIFISTLIAVTTYIFQPLGKSVNHTYNNWRLNSIQLDLFSRFNSGPIPNVGVYASVDDFRDADPPFSATSVISLKTLGLSPDVNDLSGFAAAAGYAEAAVFQGLSDPPFVQGDWATAEFTVGIRSAAFVFFALN
jgi:hypothetical protein